MTIPPPLPLSPPTLTPSPSPPLASVIIIDPIVSWQCPSNGTYVFLRHLPLCSEGCLPESCGADCVQVFLRGGQMAVLDTMRTDIMHKAAVTIQRHVRGFMVRRQTQRTRRAIIRLQVPMCMHPYSYLYMPAVPCAGLNLSDRIGVPCPPPSPRDLLFLNIRVSRSCKTQASILVRYTECSQAAFVYRDLTTQAVHLFAFAAVTAQL